MNGPLGAGLMAAMEDGRARTGEPPFAAARQVWTLTPLLAWPIARSPDEEANPTPPRN